MALSANQEVDHYIDQELRTFKVAASAHVYKGALVSVKTDGYAHGLVAGELFVGIAYEEADNSSGADGAKSVRVYTLGDFDHALSGAAIANVGDAVYASADGTLTFTATNNSYVGVCIDVPSSGNIILRLDAYRTAP